MPFRSQVLGDIRTRRSKPVNEPVGEKLKRKKTMSNIKLTDFVDAHGNHSK